MKASVFGALGISAAMTAMIMGGLFYIAQPAVAGYGSSAIAQQTKETPKASSARIVQLMAPIVVVGHKNGSTTMLLPEDGEQYQAALRQVRMAQATGGASLVSAGQSVTIVPSGISVIDVAVPASAVRTNLAKR
jgi:hypothetical protein